MQTKLTEPSILHDAEKAVADPAARATSISHAMMECVTTVCSGFLSVAVQRQQAIGLHAFTVEFDACERVAIGSC